MLSKMGWNKDKGLGAREDGSTEFITLRYKNDSNGMGFKDKDNQWTENETQFDSLLKSLNNTGTEEERKTESLEEKSKGSRARVHYKKFTRGKDTSRYSAKDLANIFGKKSLDEKDEEVAKEEKSSDEGGEKLKHGVETYESTVSSYDYFKKKMGKFFGKSDEKETSEEDKPAEVTEEAMDIEKEEKSTKKKSKKRKAEESVEESIPVEENSVPEEPTKKKKKKNKDKLSAEKEEEVIETLTLVEDEVSAEPTKKEKKSKKSKNKQQKDETDTIEILDNSIKVDDDDQVIDLNDSITEVTKVPEVKKKDKKSKKNKQEAVIDLESEQEQPQEKKSKKSKKDKKAATTDEPTETISLLEDTEDQPKKKKKKSKNEV